MNTLNINGRLLNLNKPVVMGILNLTPDSFYSNSRIQNIEMVVSAVAMMLENGASIIDLGAYSSRPGAADISEQEELERIIPAVKAIIKEFPNTILSIDTFRAEVAKATIGEGAGIINDISGGTIDPKIFEAVALLKVPYILMHMRGTPQSMASLTDYNALIPEMLHYYNEKLLLLKQLGVQDIIIDPGFGFAKTTDQNFEILKHLETFKMLDLPLLAGFSRKSMITKTLNITAKEALNGTTALNMIALNKGAKILRVHDVLEAKQCIELFEKVES